METLLALQEVIVFLVREFTPELDVVPDAMGMNVVAGIRRSYHLRDHPISNAVGIARSRCCRIIRYQRTQPT